MEEAEAGGETVGVDVDDVASVPPELLDDAEELEDGTAFKGDPDVERVLFGTLFLADGVCQMDLVDGPQVASQVRGVVISHHGTARLPSESAEVGQGGTVVG